MKNTRLLIIEDDTESALLMKEFLEEHMFVVDLFPTVTDAIAWIERKGCALIVLDLNLPDYDGYEVIKFLNHEGYKIPVIVLSAYSEIDAKLKAFKFGASDYIVKPVDPNELVARIWVHLGKNALVSRIYQTNPFTIDNRDIYYKDKPLKLTQTEYKILKILIENYGHTISREYLSEALSSKASKRSLDSHIKNIRNKIASVKKDVKNILATEYGYGYRLFDYE